MFEKRIPLFTISGFQVKLDISWFILAILITWTLAAGLFPHFYKDLPRATYWLMGAAGAVGLFASIVLHEFSHSIVARKTGTPMKGITLFVFGGVAEMEEEPPSARAEFFMSIAGPVMSVFLGFVFLLIAKAMEAASWPTAAYGIFRYLEWINFILAAFNLLPAFPLDGGRVLRSIMWTWKGDMRWATQVTSRIGSGFGIALSLFGILNFINGNFVGGLWMFLIGMFLRNAARMSYQRLITTQALEGEPVRRFMEADPKAVSPEVSVRDLVEDYIYALHYKMFPVVENDRLIGCVSTREVKEVPRERWEETKVREIVQPCSGANTISPGEDATRALSIMNKTGLSRLMVTEGGRLVGIITLKDMLKFLSLKLELEG